MKYTSRIDKIGEKHYRIVINLGRDPKTGTYKKKRKDVHVSRPEAEAILRQMLDELENPPKKYSEQLTADFLINWVDTIAKPDLEKNTYDSYRWEIEKHINPCIGHIPLSELTPLHIQTFYSYKTEAGRLDGKGGLSNRSIIYIGTILNQALNKAVDLELIEKNPCDSVKPPRDKNKKRKKEEMVILSKEELKTFLENTRKHIDWPLIHTAAYTGMRQSELLGLRREDILWKEKKIRVTMTLHRHEDGKYEHRPRTKNETSTRIIPVTRRVLAVLRWHLWKQSRKLKGLNGSSKNNDLSKILVFLDSQGNPIDRKNLSHRFSNLAAKYGHKGMRFHDLRHTHATILLAAGEMINAVSERLGHADIQTTLNIYGHVLPKKALDTAQKFEQLLS
ncbi:tyrosine-type recombinase/integrase [Thermanaerosceptrum fracticalcis]|uniref:Tyrosine-type recombinase/integrase n=1 Tax=Thermanaerosceptrum fracticalcis TaxID=1712410 RepID=A0A7G6E1C7_THEFR|nr:tyrosine-type recombinase/integrase [Thermanaerosceptrum fracticalcis]QNB45881.1 tyrosine-type recombinase/integrase [Thermanaerosceptrum fracticalcis]